MRPKKCFCLIDMAVVAPGGDHCPDGISRMRTAVKTAVGVRKEWDQDLSLNQAY